MTDTLTIEYVDPNTVLLGKNIRQNPQLSEDFVYSVKTRGVHTPCPAVRTETGEVKLVFGSRRRAAAISAGRPLPVFVIGTEDTSLQGQVDRLFDQFDENESRAPLTAQEKAGFVQDLLDFKISPTQIRKRTGLDKTAIDRARKVAASTRVMTGAPIEDLEMAATLTEFEAAGDAEAVEVLTVAIDGGRGQFRHATQLLTDSQGERFQKRDLLAELAAAGVPVLSVDDHGRVFTADGTPIGWEQHLNQLRTADRKLLTVEAHADCPGHAAYLRRTRTWNDDTDRSESGWEPEYVCTDPDGNGHQAKISRHDDKNEDPGAKEEAARQRRLVIDNNKQWRAARTVRQAWIKELLTRKDVPADALPVILGALTGCWWTRWDRSLSEAISDGHKLAGELLGLTGSGTESAGDLITAALRTASPARQQVIALGLVLAAWEATLTDETWRRYVPSIKQEYRMSGTSVAGRYLLLLAGWGYTLSDIEKLPVSALEDANSEGPAL